LIFYPKRKLEISLLNDFKRLSSVDITYEGNNSLLVDVMERKPDWIWCAGSDCFFMDEQGLVFAKAPNFSGPVFFKIQGGISVEDGGSPVGKYFQPPWQIGDMKAFVAGVKKLGYEPIGAEITIDGDTDLRLKNGPVLKLGRDKTLAVSLIDLSDALSSGLIKELDKKNYIDLRFDNKVFYK
jgi:cell division septal protein FtsQ